MVMPTTGANKNVTSTIAKMSEVDLGVDASVDVNAWESLHALTSIYPQIVEQVNTVYSSHPLCGIYFRHWSIMVRVNLSVELIKLLLLGGSVVAGASSTDGRPC
jgi:hypothetical protein